MFVSDRIIVDNYKEDDDVIDDERDNPSKGCDARPTANNKKPMMTLMLMLQKKKKKNRKENIAFRESCDGSASSKNINFSKPNKVVLFPFIKPSRLFHKKSTPPPAAANNADCFPATALREGYGDSQGYWFLERLACRFSAMLSTVIFFSGCVLALFASFFTTCSTLITLDQCLCTFKKLVVAI
uniref:Uncharacterized protein n=1 Tax=Salix viminalis TaxID=40686 RepID=A0A6N2KIB4_SALVM